MFVGHGLVAFGLAALAAHHWGLERHRALGLGLLAAAFATVPDVDVVHPLVAVALAPVDPLAVPETFWAASTVVHRAETHSLLVGAAIAVGAAASTVRDVPGRLAGRYLGPGLALGVLAGLVLTVARLSGPLSAAVVTLAALVGLAVAEVARRSGYTTRQVLVVALLGLLTHPFGDMFTGQPPPFFYPLGAELVGARISLHADPTVHLLGAFLLELATVWFGLAVLARLSGWRLRSHVHPRALLAVAYGVAVFALPPPTLDASTPFVFSVLAVGVLGAPVGLGDSATGRRRTFVTALTAVTAATLAFTGVYLLT